MRPTLSLVFSPIRLLEFVNTKAATYLKRPNRSLRSLAEVQAIGAEAGLDADDIAEAAAAIRPPARHWFAGGGARFRVSRTLPFLGEHGMTDVVGAVRQATGYQGELRWLPTEIEWRVRSGMGAVIVTFTPRATKTRVDLLIARDDARAMAALGSGFASLLLGVWIGRFVGHGLGAGLAAGLVSGFVTFAGSTVALTRALWSSSARRWQERTDDLARVIERAGLRVASTQSDESTGL